MGYLLYDPLDSRRGAPRRQDGRQARGAWMAHARAFGGYVVKGRSVSAIVAVVLMLGACSSGTKKDTGPPSGVVIAATKSGTNLPSEKKWSGAQSGNYVCCFDAPGQ